MNEELELANMKDYAVTFESLQELEKITYHRSSAGRSSADCFYLVGKEGVVGDLLAVRDAIMCLYETEKNMYSDQNYDIRRKILHLKATCLTIETMLNNLVERLSEDCAALKATRSKLCDLDKKAEDE